LAFIGGSRLSKVALGSVATSPGVRTDDVDRRRLPQIAWALKNQLRHESIISAKYLLKKLRDTVHFERIEPDRASWRWPPTIKATAICRKTAARILAARLKTNADSWLDVRKAYSKLPTRSTNLSNAAMRGGEGSAVCREYSQLHEDILTKLENRWTRMPRLPRRLTMQHVRQGLGV
jgi:hypothetical protein